MLLALLVPLTTSFRVGRSPGRYSFTGSGVVPPCLAPSCHLHLAPHALLIPSPSFPRTPAPDGRRPVQPPSVSSPLTPSPPPNAVVAAALGGGVVGVTCHVL